jgi:hypothetical protein
METTLTLMKQEVEADSDVAHTTQSNPQQKKSRAA